MGNLPLKASHNDGRLRALSGFRRLGQRFQRMPVSGRIPLRNIAVPSSKNGPQQLSKSLLP